jgi:hypothetical protein
MLPCNWDIWVIILNVHGSIACFQIGLFIRARRALALPTLLYFLCASLCAPTLSKVQIHIHAYIYAFLPHTCICTFVYSCIHLYSRHTCIHIYIHTFMHTYTQTSKHKYIYIHIYRRRYVAANRFSASYRPPIVGIHRRL